MNETPTSWKRVPLFAYGWYTDQPGRRIGMYNAGHTLLPHDSRDAACVNCGISEAEIFAQALVGQCSRTNV